MVIGLIIKLIKTIIDGIANFFSWLFVVLGLWIPMVYALVFVIVCALKGIAFTAVTTQFFIGLFLSLAASVALSVWRAERMFKRRRKRSSGMSEAKKKDEYSAELVMDNAAYENPIDQNNNKQGVVNSTSVVPEKVTDYGLTENALPAEPEPKAKMNILEEARAEDERKRIEAGLIADDTKTSAAESDGQTSASPEKSDGKPHDPSQVGSSAQTPGTTSGVIQSETPADTLENRYSREPQVVLRGDYCPGEMPRIFATRKDPTIFIYEYAARLDFYKRTRQGMIYMYSEYKNG